MARLIRIQDLAELLQNPAAQLERELARKGIAIQQHHGQAAVVWEELASYLDAKVMRRLETAVEKRGFHRGLLTWTVASFPELLTQWDHKRNHGLEPSEVSFRSDKVVWWKCAAARDHAWEAAPVARVKKLADGSYRFFGCPFCSFRRVARHHSLASEFPEIAKEWHPEQNGELRPSDVAPKTAKIVWWQCSEKHVWQASISNRTNRGAGCPYCAGTRLLPEASFAVKEPALAAQWHPTKNGTLKPTDISAGSRRLVWWKCPAATDHEWEAFPSARCRTPNCPFCTNKRVAKSNSLAQQRPDLARQWHPTRNGELTPRDVVPATGRKIWWKCTKGPDHEWICSGDKRVRNQGCPFCSGKRVCKSNSLAGLHPKVAKQWHPTRNGETKPSEVHAGSKFEFWWCCQLGHAWRMSVRARTALGHGCPKCTE